MFRTGPVWMVGLIIMTILAIIGIALFPVALPVLMIVLLIAGVVAAIFATYTSVKCKKSIISHILAFMFAPFWLVHHYLMGGKNTCISAI